MSGLIENLPPSSRITLNTHLFNNSQHNSVDLNMSNDTSTSCVNEEEFLNLDALATKLVNRIITKRRPSVLAKALPATQFASQEANGNDQ